MVLDCFDNPVAHVKKDLYIFGTTLWSKIIRERFADTRMNDYHQIYSSDVNDDIPIEPCITNADVVLSGFDDEEDHSKIEALNDRNLAHDSIVSLEWKQF